MKKKLQRFISLFLVLILTVGNINHICIKADVIDDSTSISRVYDSKGQEVLTITMKNGEIRIDGQSHAASTNVRWETIGLTVTKEPIATHATAKNLPGPGSVSDAYGSGKGVIHFRENEKIPSSDGSTHILVTSTHVQEALGEDFAKIEENTTVYLHCIFATYKISNGIKTIRKNDIRDWKSIMEAESWGASTLNDFTKFFNMPIKFKPAAQPNSLYYVAEDGTKLKYVVIYIERI